MLSLKLKGAGSGQCKVEEGGGDATLAGTWRVGGDVARAVGPPSGKVTWHYNDGQLTLRGCVPSFHMKQLLQELLRGIEQVTQITNSVDVISSTGLSSERSHTPELWAVP